MCVYTHTHTHTNTHSILGTRLAQHCHLTNQSTAGRPEEEEEEEEADRLLLVKSSSLAGFRFVREAPCSSPIAFVFYFSTFFSPCLSVLSLPPTAELSNYICHTEVPVA